MHHWPYYAPSGFIVGQKQLLHRIHQKAGTEASYWPKNKGQAKAYNPEDISQKKMFWSRAFSAPRTDEVNNVKSQLAKGPLL